MSDTVNKWTVLVYLAGNNNLAEECVFDLTEMKKVGSDERMTIVAQLETSVIEGNIFVLKNDGGRLKDDVLSTPNVPTPLPPAPADGPKGRQAALPASSGPHTYADVIKEFVRRGVEESRNRLEPRVKEGLNPPEPGVEESPNPPESGRCLLVLSGHGNGTNGDFLKNDNRLMFNNLSIPDLQEMLGKIKYDILQNEKIDIFGLDCCLMSMAEVCYALRDSVKYLIGAEGFEPLAGWPFANILKVVKGSVSDEGQTQISDDQVKDLAKTIVQQYIGFYRDYQAAGLSVDQAACDLSQSDNLAKAVTNLATTLKNRLENPRTEADAKNAKKALILAHWEAQSYKNEQYVDLFDFCDLLKQHDQSAEVVAACQNVINVIKGSAGNPEAGKADAEFRSAAPFVLRSCFSGGVVQYSNGISIYFPWAKVPADLDSYNKLDFAQATGWGKFLETYLTATQRQPRYAELHQPEQAVQLTAAQKARQYQVSKSDAVSEFAPSATTPANVRSSLFGRSGTITRDMGNITGSMRNPPIEFYDSPCGNESADKSESKNKSPGNATA